MEFFLVLIIAVFVLRPQDWQRLAALLGKALRLWRYYQAQLKLTLAQFESASQMQKESDVVKKAYSSNQSNPS